MLRLEIPLKTISAANAREHYQVKARRVKSERQAVAWVLVGKKPPTLDTHRVVTLTRIGPRALDGDNLQSAFKAVRDQLAQWLGVDDGSPLVTWNYSQRRGKPREYAVEVSIA